MEEINLKELLDYFKSKIVLILVILLFVVGCGSIYSIFNKTPMYSSSTTIILASETVTQTVGTDGKPVVTTTFNQSDVDTYGEIIKSKKVLDKTISNLGLDMEYTYLAKNITVAYVDKTSVIKITVANEDSTVATDVANELVAVFSDYISDNFNKQNVSIVDVAEEPISPYNINFKKDVAIYTLAGAVLSLGIVFVIYYFDNTLKSAEIIESKFDLPVLGTVPRVKRKKK